MSHVGNKLQSQRTAHVVTAGEEAAGFAVIPVRWDIRISQPYTLVCSCHDFGVAPAPISVVFLDSHNVTPDGFNAVILCGAGTTGEDVEVNSIALAD